MAQVKIYSYNLPASSKGQVYVSTRTARNTYSAPSIYYDSATTPPVDATGAFNGISTLSGGFINPDGTGIAVGFSPDVPQPSAQYWVPDNSTPPFQVDATSDLAYTGFFVTQFGGMRAHSKWWTFGLARHPSGGPTGNHCFASSTGASGSWAVQDKNNAPDYTNPYYFWDGLSDKVYIFDQEDNPFLIELDLSTGTWGVLHGNTNISNFQTSNKSLLLAGCFAFGLWHILYRNIGDQQIYYSQSAGTNWSTPLLLSVNSGALQCCNNGSQIIPDSVGVLHCTYQWQSGGGTAHTRGAYQQVVSATIALGNAHTFPDLETADGNQLFFGHGVIDEATDSLIFPFDFDNNAGGVNPLHPAVYEGTPVSSPSWTRTLLQNDGLDNFTCSFAVTEAQSPTFSLGCPIEGGSATVGIPYTATLVVTGGTPPYTFELLTGPLGMTVDSSGVIHWTPTLAGTFFYAVKVTDSTGATAEISSDAPCSITVGPGTNPPEPPALCILNPPPSNEPGLTAVNEPQDLQGS